MNCDSHDAVIRVLVVLVVVAQPAYAAKHPRFEPTDLEMENPGITEIDLQLGPMRGGSAWRLVVPDFEIDLGILERVELDLDGAYAIEGVPVGGPVLFDHSLPDNLWPSLKLELADWHDHTWALGTQLGPKIPLAPNSSGVGFEGLVLVGRAAGAWHAIVNAGFITDPHVGTAPRPTGIEGGLDLQIDIVKDRWAFLGELGGIYYTSPDAHQLAATAGIQYSVNEQLDLSIVALVGFASGSDPYGLLFGVSPKLAVW